MPAKLSSIYRLDTFSTKVPAPSTVHIEKVNSTEEPYFQLLSDKSHHTSENACPEEHNPSKMVVPDPEKVFVCTINQESYEQTEPVFRRPICGQAEKSTVNNSQCGSTLYPQKQSSLQDSCATKEDTNPKLAVNVQTHSSTVAETQYVQRSSLRNGNQPGLSTAHSPLQPHALTDQTRQSDTISYPQKESFSKRLKLDQCPGEDPSHPNFGTKDPQASKQPNRLPEESIEQRKYRETLEKQCLQEKVTKIVQDYGIANLDENVYSCLTMSVKQYLRDVLCKAIRFSKKSLDNEKQHQETVVTTNVAEKLMQIKRKENEAARAREKEATETSLQESSDVKRQQESNNEKLEDKVEDQPKKPKTRKAVNPKPVTSLPPRRNAATEEMLIKWQIMAEQARLKRESQAGSEASSTENIKKDAPVTNNQKQTVLPTGDSGRPPGSSERINNNKNTSTNRTGSSLKPCRLITTQKRCRSINLKDIIAVLEMDHRMNKSGLLYRLYNKFPSTNIG